jgi:tyrosine-protein phosphatase SIW14
MRRTLVQPFVILAVLFLAGGLTAAEKAPQKAPRPDAWAKPIAAEYVRNFFQLDEKVYRSAQPTRKGFQELQARGIRNVLNLRDYHSDEDDAQDTVLSLYRVKMEAGDITDEKVIEALRIIRKAEGPVLVHCWHGSDRTGLIAAMYRIVFQDWSKKDAIDELVRGGYGYHATYSNIPEYIAKTDIEEIKKQVLAP